MRRTGDWMRVAFAGLIAAQSMIFGLAINLSPPTGTARTVLHAVLAASAVLVFALVGWPLLRNACRSLRQGRITFEQFFMVGILAAFGASIHCSLTGQGHVYYEVVAILLTIYTFGRILAEQRKNAALSAAEALGEEFDRCERILQNGSTEFVRAREILSGDRIRVLAGGAIPVDGVIEQGVGYLVETPLTGEPFPVVKRVGDPVFAGSHTVDDALEICATASGSARRLDAVFQRVREAREKPAWIQREADRLAAWFLPVVLVVAAGTFGLWTYASGWQTGLFNALSVILVACPCAMGLATPIGIWSAMADLAKRGIATTNSDLIEQLAKVDAVIFDKTGTLGEADLEIVDFVTTRRVDRTALLARVAALESASGHPIARAFRKISPSGRADRIEVLSGLGIRGHVDVGGDDCLLAVGNPGLIDPADAETAATLRTEFIAGADEGSHELAILTDGALVGLARLRERLRDSTRPGLRALEAGGIHLEILTGDRAESAAIHGLPNVRAGLSPMDKVDAIRQLREAGHHVLFVGDGVNDAAAMGEANASLALRGGSGLARDAAMGELIGGDIEAVSFAIARSREAIRTIRHNLWFAAGYNMIAISLAAAGILHPVAAALIMLVSSFTVSTRALSNSSLPKPLSETSPVRESRPLSVGFAGALALSVGIAVQGPLVVYLGAFEGWVASAYVGLFLLAAAVCFFWLRTRRFDRTTEMALGMFSLGGVAMLMGWWADAGLAPIVRNGVCLCGCASSAMGLGIFAKLNWMTAGMVVASLPALFIDVRWVPQAWHRVFHWLAGLIGMIFGMEVAMWVMAQLPTTLPQVHFFATYGAMAFGMLTGMLAACSAWNRILKPS